MVEEGTAEAEDPTAVEAVASTVAGVAEDISRAARAVAYHLGGRPWAAAQLRDLVADAAGLRAVHRARPRLIAAPLSAVAVRSQGPLQAHVPAQALWRAALDQARRPAIPPPPMASGTPLLE